MKHTKPIAYTLGEPAGIGADIVLQLAQSDNVADIVCIGSKESLTQRAHTLGLLDSLQRLVVEDVPVAEPHAIGVPIIANATGVLNMLDRSIEGCLNGEFSAMLTGPLHKGIINDAGIAFSGHTEYLASKTGATRSVMLLASPSLRVALQTTHLPLKDVSAAITHDAIVETCTIIHADLIAKFGITHPCIVVCGLNPHAGESGHLGDEEIKVIQPAIDTLKANGINVKGPVPADTAFTPSALAGVDVVLAMYHDQGLPMLKSQSFGEAANITLGLPIIRTSVDHGTAFDIVGTGRASIGGLKEALRVARLMVKASQ